MVERDFDAGVTKLRLRADGETLVGVEFIDRCERGGSSEVVDEAERQLRDYFAGRRREFDLALDARGTAFQRRVWDALLEIPYGGTWSYADLAERVGSPRGFRAVGAANGRNPLAIVIPCHRVINSGGKLGGYGGGLPLKKKLLELEGVPC